jgi:predicted small lipoprotein YifL
MRLVLSLILLSTLAACGADGEPQPPARAGVSITGQAFIGADARL